MTAMSRKSSAGATSPTSPPKVVAPARRRSPREIALPLLLWCITAPLASWAARKALHPIYGSTAARADVPIVIALAYGLALVLEPSWLSTRSLLVACGTLLCAAPATSHWIGIVTARGHDPLKGVKATHVSVLFPILSFGTLSLARRATRSPPAEGSERINGKFVVLAATLGLHLGLNYLLDPLLDFQNFTTSSTILISLGLLTSLLCILTESAPATRKQNDPAKRLRKYLMLAFPLLATFYSLSQPPFIRHLPLTKNLGQDVVTLLASTDSVTGRIVVSEDPVQEIRYLRADHSLLGGIWTGTKAPKDDIGDSIYAAFVLQEAARLARHHRDGEEKDESALVIGLGAGIAARAFMRHGINVTLVEIDPAVYHDAVAFFGLTPPNRVFLEDARGWVHHRAHNDSTNKVKFDYIIHDCFSGGGVPSHLFTREFFDDLKSLVKPEGIVVVNAVGRSGSDAFRSVAMTLIGSFSECRAFTDEFEPEKRTPDSFSNFVFFCSPGSSVVFRQANPSDFLNSRLREYVLSSLDSHEINLKQAIGNTSVTVLTDGYNPLSTWQKDSAIEHWKVMRGVLPDIHWEVY